MAGIDAGGHSTRAAGGWSPAEASVLAAVHDPQYVNQVREFCAELAPDEIAQLPTGDTNVCDASYDIACLAAGTALQAVAAAREGAPALAAVRPPGHHAMPDRGMGFCIFNNVAIAAAWAREHIGSTLVLDFDYHHGNGTQAWIERALGDGKAPIGFVSTHAFPAYPGTGRFAESRITSQGFVFDVPLAHSTETHDSSRCGHRCFHRWPLGWLRASSSCRQGLISWQKTPSRDCRSLTGQSMPCAACSRSSPLIGAPAWSSSSKADTRSTTCGAADVPSGTTSASIARICTCPRPRCRTILNWLRWPRRYFHRCGSCGGRRRGIARSRVDGLRRSRRRNRS
ncbi:MAG: hypothetical protein GIW99_06200 [Candidatus Eremiobacteraeota bacterium]|nr:hypothetical protein [Candidatus Eremiobacteraeota bacterium]MBC5827259.1 hypothetical protein [Candidatus Eremiobacteraeota bacterium]